ncbi:MAG: hypothetical protein K8R59_01905 [Thermoanaerobaculales bacterium]|nr:hypothetical protein [Thermoanaerobaculales bacterium]
MQSGDDTFFLSREGERFGPYSWAEICRFGEEGNLFAGDLLWSVPLSSWTSVEQIDSLQAFVVPVQAKRPGSRKLLFLLLIPLLAALGLALFLFLSLSPDRSYTVTDVASYSVTPSSEEQVISYGERVKVRLPAHFCSKEQTLSVGRVEDASSIMVEDALPLMLVDLKLDGGKQPSQPVDLSLVYDPEDLSPDHTPEEQLAAFRWDEEGGGWVNLPMRIDEENHTVSVLIDHFSVAGVMKLLGILPVSGSVYVASDIGEWLLNDVYITPEKNFRILYSKEAIDNDNVTNDRFWKREYSTPGFSYKRAYPRYIQDMGYFLEGALKSYTATHHFRNPVGTRISIFGEYRKTLTVKMDSYFTALSGKPSYEKIHERLHIPTSNANFPDFAKVTLAHELFHAVQAEYCGISGMMNPINGWWLEATADYAAYVVAWPAPLKGLDFGCGHNYLTFPVTDRGRKYGPGWTDREYEYLTSVWVKHLVEAGIDFKGMFEAVALDGAATRPISSLGLYLAKRGGIFARYRAFAAWMAFSSKGWLKSFPLATFNGDTSHDIAVNRNTLTLGDGKKTVYTFDLPAEYTSKMWVIQLKKAPASKDSKKKPIVVKVKKKTSGVVVDLFVVPKGGRTLNPPTPTKSLFKEDQSVMVTAGAGDLLCIAASQGDSTEGSADVVVTDAGILLEIDPPELLNAVFGTRYSFKLQATQIPEKVDRAQFEWDFGDGIGESTGFEGSAVVGGEAEVTISHTYEESEKEETYPLKVILKDDKGVVLAEAEAKVVLPLVEAEVVVMPRHSVGPPGATFGLEAIARPAGKYRFQWEMEGQTDVFTQEGAKSEIAPALEEEGEFFVTVKLFSLDGTYLGKDQVTVVVEPDDGPMGQWILVEKGARKANNPVVGCGSMKEGRSQYTIKRVDWEDGDRKEITLGAFCTWSIPPDVIPAGTVVTVNYSVTDQSDSMTEKFRKYLSTEYTKGRWSASSNWHYQQYSETVGLLLDVISWDPWGIKYPEEIYIRPGDGPKNAYISFKAGDGTRHEDYLYIGITTRYGFDYFHYTYTYKLKPGTPQ